MDKKEILEKIQALQDKKAELTSPLVSDGTSEASVLTTDKAEEIVGIHRAITDLSDKLNVIQEAERIAKGIERREIARDIQLGSDMHSDLASWLHKETGGDLFNLGQDEIELPIDFFMNMVFSDDETFRDTVQQRPNTSAVPDVPRNRGVGIGAPARERFAPTSFLDVVPSRSTSDSKISYIKMAWGATRAGDVNENGSVGEAAYSNSLETDNMNSYALHVPVTRQALRDIPQMRAELIAMLRADVRQALDKRAWTRIKASTDVQVKGTEVATEKIVPVFLKELNAAADETYTTSSHVLMTGATWSALKLEAADEVDTYNIDPYFDGRRRMLDGVPVVITPGISDEKHITGGAYNNMMINEFVISENVRMSIGTSNDDFLKRRIRIMLEVEGEYVLKVGAALARFKNDPANTGGYF